MSSPLLESIWNSNIQSLIIKHTVISCYAYSLLISTVFFTEMGPVGLLSEYEVAL